MMDVQTRLKLLQGPVRPFIPGKLRDALRSSIRLLLLGRRVPFANRTTLALNRNVISVPSKQWLNVHGGDVVLFARSAANGIVQAYGIDSWHIGNSLSRIGDFRGVLELARMHHWCAYALAAHVDAEDPSQWFLKFREELHAFVQQYPAPRGDFWSVGMDVGIRVHSMLAAYDWFFQAGYHDSETEQIVAGLASDHGYVIDARMERAGGMSTSHYLGTLLGLLTVSAYLVGEESLINLARIAASEIRQQIELQILDDGMSFEASTAYHRHVVDILVRTTRVLLEQPFEHDALDEEWWLRLSKAIYAQRILESVGMPIIGDNDDGMAVKVLGYSADTTAMLDDAARLSPLQNACSMPLERNISFPDFGLWIYSHNVFTLAARCGSNGQYGKGGHAHNDKNSITLCMNNEKVIVDPGSCWYSGNPERRNLDRSVKAHATVVINNAEQSHFLPGRGENLWWMFDEPGFEVEGGLTTWRGVVGSEQQRHIRTIAINEEIEIHDVIHEASGGKVIIPLGHTIQAAMGRNTVTLRGEASVIVLRWSNAEAEIVPIDVALAFAESVASTAIILTMLSNELTWTISPILE
jgi:hypothetical protein